jgi:SNF2 family DNA or RNA helicase
MSQVEELVLEHLAAGKKVVVFTYRRVIAEMLANAAAGAGFKAATIHGGVPMMRRQKAIDSIAAAPAGLLTATIDTAGTGINLSFAYTVVFAETTWEPHEMLQAEARCGRDVGGMPVLVQYPIASGTIDEIVVGKLLAKLETRDKAIGRHDDGLAKSLSGDEEDVFAAIARDLERQK